MRKKFIADYKKGDSVTDFFLVKDVAVKTTQNGKLYANLVVADKNSDLACKKWDLTDADKGWYEDILRVGDIIKIRGTIDMFNDAPQMIIELIRFAGEGDEFDLNDIIKTAPVDPEKMYKEIIETIVSEISDSDYRNLCQYVLDQHKPQLLYWPAAKKIHHAHMGGLLWHTYRMMKTALKLCEVYTCVNKSLLLAGTVLHDIGKLYEMDSNEYGIVSEYTVEGELLGHLVMGAMIVKDAAQKVNAGMDYEKILVLQHMLASHHGPDPEMGSARKPCILESYLLHEIDMIDMYAYVAEEEYAKIGEGEMTPSLFALGRGKLYKPVSYDKGSEV